MKKEQEYQYKAAAGIIIDALIDAGLLKEEDGERALDIVTEELVVRKVIRKL